LPTPEEPIPPSETPPITEPEEPEQPKKIIREPLAAEELPEKPEIQTPLYPDQSRWYNHLGEVIALWNLPLDTTEIETKLSKTRDKNLGNIETELFTGKSFGILEEGIWHIRVQFRNNIGWGDFSYYKISLDTTPPLPFEVKIDNKVTDNPIPEIEYETQDSLSGISHSLIFINGKDPILTTTTISKLPPQPPGKHNVLVRVFDLAGNSIEDDLDFEILALPTPTIDFITKEVTHHESIFASGKTIPNTFIDIRMLNKAGQEVLEKVASSDELGRWKILIEEHLVVGKYTFSVMARDDRGALSYPIEDIELRIKDKAIISIGFMDLSWFEIFIIVILLIISSISVSAWYYTSEQNKRKAYGIIAERDIEKISALLSSEVKKLESSMQKATLAPEANAEIKYSLEKIKDIINKMKKYLIKEIKELK